MGHLTPQEIIVLFLSLGILLGAARLLGELAQKLRQPAVLGELLAGVLLGPTVLGALAPGISAFLFPAGGPNAIALETVATLAIVLFMLVAGMEVDLSTVWAQGRAGFKVGVTSMVIPFLFALALAWLNPQSLGRQSEAPPLVFALFLATAFAISALPVIAKTLMDMNLYRSDLGIVIVSAAIFNDLIGWLAFAVVLGMINPVPGYEGRILMTISLTLLFAGVVLTIGRWLIHRALPFLQAYTVWPGGVMGFALTLALLGAALTEWIGIHAIFGSFLIGIAIGDSSHLREHTRVTIEHFVSFIFAPVFFASIGLKVNFLEHFDASLIATVLMVACACKIIGGTLGARWGGMTPRESWAVGFAMNSRGAMEIILGILALEAGIIRQRLFVALIIMAIVTSMMSGPMMRYVLQPTKKRRLTGLLSAKLFLRQLQADSRRTAIGELTAAACRAIGLDPKTVEAAVWERESITGTGIGNGVAIPHARLEGLKKPLAVVGFSDAGIDFDAPDGRPAHLIFLLLTPADDPGAQLELAAKIARIFRDPVMLDRVLQTRRFTDFLALLKSVSAGPEAI
ncbi:MAG: cation:proton antiporter [Thermodesulfobacteriota bacterium]